MKYWKEILIGLFIALIGPVAGKALAATPIKNQDPIKYLQVSKQEVVWMYTMKTRFWDDGTRVTVIYQDFNSKVHKDFCIEVLGVTTDRFERNVETYINRGNAAYFILADNESGVITRVARTQGAIGYISSDVVAINKNGHVALFKIVD